ncbi:MAG: AAA family ATPase [Sedimentisphaerales bacterium]|nr:AAA family ATPase [Sedimentisphaerales bacterium]
MKPIYISATLKDSGKTSVSLGLMQLLHDRKVDPGYCKPVGQHYVQYQGKNIDEDGVLMHQVFNLPDEPYYLSPIAIERGFTTKFIFNPDVSPLEKEILACRDHILKTHPMIIVEGTGHAGVGSCFGLSNARVAQILDSKVVIVTSGGIGRPLDEIALSLALFADHKVEVLGVILNKVLPEKLDRIRKTVDQGLKNMGTRLLGAIPYDPALTFFTVGQVAEEFQYDVLCGADSLSNRIEHTVVAAMEPQHVLEYVKDKTLVIIPGDRLDNILISLLALAENSPDNGGLILTGGFDPHPRLMPLMKNSKVPILLSKEDTFTVSSRMADIGFKIRSYDADKIARLHELVRQFVDTDLILERLQC